MCVCVCECVCVCVCVCVAQNVKKSCHILMSHKKTFLHGLKVHGKFFKIVGQKDGLTGGSIRNGLVSAKNMEKTMNVWRYKMLSAVLKINKQVEFVRTPDLLKVKLINLGLGIESKTN